MTLVPLYILVAFASGLLAQRVSLPPLVGYLAAGFGLHAVGVESQGVLEDLANIGITLLLFVIGLKLNIRQLIKVEIWAGAAMPMLLSTSLAMGFIVLLSFLGLPLFVELDMKTAALIGFTLSFSSTVVAVQMLEQRGELKSRHGQVTLGILVIQDIVAVGFLAISSGKWPSVWALGLLVLPFAQPLFFRVLNACKHGEILPLAGFGFAYFGGLLFEWVNLKADLGALIMGALLHSSLKANELAKSLMGFKDLFLVAFFLSIGFMALPDLSMVLAAALLLVLIPVKSLLFFGFLTRFRLRARTAFLSTLSLSNFSEFGLIVGVMSVSTGWLSETWLVVIALTVSFSFVFSSILSSRTHGFYASYQKPLKEYEKPDRLPEDLLVLPDNPKVLIIGMGRVGKGCYKETSRVYGEAVWGVDSDAERIAKLKNMDMQVIRGDAEDADFWDNVNLTSIEVIMLAMPSQSDMLDILKQLKLANYQGKVAAIAKYEDDRAALLAAGANIAFNMYAQAGSGFASEAFAHFDPEYRRPECLGSS